MGNHSVSVVLPGLAAIKRAADEDAIACSPAGPIVGRAQLVKGDIAKDGVACGVVRERDIAGDAIILGRGAVGYFPRLAAVLGVRGACGHLPCDHSLPRILWIHRDGGLVEISGRRRYSGDVGVRRWRQWLRECDAGADNEEQNWDSHKFKIATYSK